MVPAQQRLHGDELVAGEIDLRLIGERELAGRQRAAQVDLERAARLDARVHVRLEEAERAAPLGLGAIEREVGAFHQVVGGAAVVRRERDADADAGIDLLPVDLDRLGDDLDQPARERARRLRRSSRHCRIANSSPPSRAIVSSSRDRAADALRDGAEQLVADRMAERVVDALEIVEVEAEHRHRLAVRLDAREALGHLLAQQHAVRQFGQRVVARHVRDALLGAVALGDVLVDRDPAALRHRLVGDLDDAPVGEMAVHDQVAGAAATAT